MLRSGAVKPTSLLFVLAVLGACSPSTARLQSSQRVQGELSSTPQRFRLPETPVELVLEGGRSGAQLIIVKGEARTLVDRRPGDAPERIALASTEGLEVELAPPEPLRAVKAFTLTVSSPTNVKELAALDESFMAAVASTTPSTGEGLRKAAATLIEGATKANALGDGARAGEHLVTAAELLLRVSEPEATQRFVEAMASPVYETVASAHLGIAAIDHEQGRLEVAIEHVADARAIAGTDELLHARVDIAESDSLAERAEHAQSVGKLVPRLELVRREGDPQLIAAYESAIGWGYKSLGDKAKGLQHFERGHAAALLTKDGRAIGHALHDLGGMKSDESDWAGALPFYLKAIEVRRISGDRQGLAFSLDAAGEMESTLLDDVALKHHAEALILRREIKTVRGEAQTLCSLGSALGRLNRPGEAMEPLHQAAKLFAQLGDLTWEAYTYYRLGRAELMAKHYPEAVAWAEKSLAMTDSLRERIASEDRRAYYTAGVRKFYDLWVAAAALQSMEKKDLKWLEKAVEASERARARSLLDFLMLVDLDRPADQQGLVAEEDKLRTEIRDLENAARRFKATAGADAGTPPQEATLELKLAEYEAIHGKLQSADPRVASLQSLPLVTLAEVDSLVGADSLVVEYYLGRNGNYALVLGGKTPGAYLLEAKDLAGQAETLHKLYSARNEDVAGENAAARAARIAAADAKAEELKASLRKGLISPFEPLLAGKRRLVIVADGTLHLLPWAALVPEVPVQSTPSLSVLKAQRALKRPPPTGELVAVGDPVFEADDPRLSGKEVVDAGVAELRAGEKAHYQRLISSRAECEALGSLVPEPRRKVLLDFDASKEKLNASGKPRIVHIATHGVLDTEHPERSGLVLSRRSPDGKSVDGFLSLAEVYGLKLPADLVTLSACETALGEEVRGEGFIGLARGFLHAGARSVVASLWKVNDKATSELMKSFYVGVLQMGLPPDKALARAQKELASQERYKSPYYWAGFVLYGG